MWNILLTATIETAIGLIGNAGFADELTQLTSTWRNADERARRLAFDKAVEQAFAGLINAADQEKVRTFVEHRPIRDEMLAGLLDPVSGFDMSYLADSMGDRFPRQARSLRRFFSNLETALLQDGLWGPTLERFHELRFRDDVIAALKERNQDLSPRELVQSLDTRLEKELGIKLDGSGAIAQGDGAVAAGEGGMAIGGDVQQIVQYFIQELTLPTEDGLPDNATLYQRYLQQVATQTGILRGLDYASADPNSNVQIKLADIYINLDTTHQVPIGYDIPASEHRELREPEVEFTLDSRSRGDQSLSALKALIENPRMILLGGPGGGKSTFVNHLTFCLASHGMQPDAGWLERLPEWPPERQGLTPLRIILRDVAAWIQTTQPNQTDCGLFTAYLTHWLTQNALADYDKPLTELLHQGNILLLLDGLDEVPVDAHLRERMMAMIEAVGETFSGCPILITSRVLSYREDSNWQLDAKQWQDFELAAFSETKIETFIQTWYQQLQQLGQVDDGDERSQGLLQAVHRPDLWRLAKTPLLLTVMAMVHARNNELPDARALLYEEVVDLLLWRWDAIKIRSKDGKETDLRQLLEVAGLKDIDLKQLLWETAFTVHGSVKDEGSEATADIPERMLLRGLQQLHPSQDLNWADQMVAIVKQRAGLLVEDVPGTYRFPHRTFQEYLAACYLSNQGDFGEKGSDLAKQGVFWKEVLLLAVGRLIHNGDTDKPLVLISHLCVGAEGYAGGDASDDTSDDTSDDAIWSQVWRAGDALVEIGLERARRNPLGKDMISKTQTHLKTLITEDHLSPRERAEAGALLAEVGDPRDFDEMVEIPAGPFTMGSTTAEISQLVEDYPRNKEWWEAEGPQKRIEVPQFLMSKYLVTNMQYDRFIDATDHAPPQHWNGSSPPQSLLSHPVTHVSWNDAVAYCKWLTDEKGVRYRLPTEAEWEKAARGMDDARIYPWVGSFDAKFCNMAETGIGSTSPVGIFKVGASPYGCLDMVGNVWEWTQSIYKEYPYNPDDGREKLDSDGDRTCRGGSFNNDGDDVRCAYRDNDSPTLRDDDLGFRILSPGS